MSDELEMDLEGIVCAVIQLLSWNLPGGTEQNHKNPQNNWCPGQHVNRAPEYKYRALPLHKPFQH